MANSVLSKVGVDGKVCIFTSADADYLVDVNAAFPAESAFESLSPSRLLDTRGPGLTVDGLFSGDGPVSAGSIIEVDIAGRSNVPADIGAVSLTLTAVLPDAAGYATAFPCGSPPNASNLNFTAGQVVANSVLVEVSDAGSVCIFSSADANYLIDVNGVFPG